MANCRYNFLRHISFPSPNCKLGAGLFTSITLRANLIALNKFKKKILIFLNSGLLRTQEQLQNNKFCISFHMPFKKHYRLFKNENLYNVETYSETWEKSKIDHHQL